MELMNVLQVVTPARCCFKEVREFVSGRTADGAIEEFSPRAILPVPDVFRLFGDERVSKDQFLRSLAEFRLSDRSLPTDDDSESRKDFTNSVIGFRLSEPPLPITDEIAEWLMSTHGATSDTAWAQKNWGMFEDLEITEAGWDDAKQSIGFYSHLSPPSRLYRKLSEMFPHAEFRGIWKAREDYEVKLDSFRAGEQITDRAIYHYEEDFEYWLSAMADFFGPNP